MIDFSILPPEINSARIYAGPGAGPLMEVAAAWDAIATQLSLTAQSITAEISGLDAVWSGPSSSAMTAAAMVHVAWLMETASNAVTTSASASTAAAAYEAAFAATVPPPLIAANRTRLAVLVATNFLGINAAAIAATEAEYAEYWAQDATAMAVYQAASLAATPKAPFTPPTPTTTGVAPAAVSQAAGNTQGVLGALQSFDPTQGWVGLFNQYVEAFVSSGAPIQVLSLFTGLFQPQQDSSGGSDDGSGTAVFYNPNSYSGASGGGGSGSNAPDVPGAQAPQVKAAIGQAKQVGGLSAPRSWQTTPTPEPVATPIVNEPPIVPPLMLGSTSSTQRPKYGKPVKAVRPHPWGG